MESRTDQEREEATRFYLEKWLNVPERNGSLERAIRQGETELAAKQDEIEILQKTIREAETALATKPQEIRKLMDNLDLMRRALLFGRDMEQELEEHGPK
jgi:septal ring factor EnvC (AmiA/AmiB activator)